MVNYSPLIGITFWAILVGLYSKSKGYSFFKYFLFSYLITPILSFFLTILLVNKNKLRKRAASAGIPLGEYVVRVMKDDGVGSADMIFEACQEHQTNPTALKEYLKSCKKRGCIKGGYADLLFEHFFPGYSGFLPI